MSINIKLNKKPISAISEVDFQNLVFGRTYADHMFVADYDGEWTDFRIEPYGPLSLTPGNATLHYGQSIFEGMKAYRTIDDQVKLFRPEKNWARLNRSAERMQMPAISEEIFFDGLNALLNLDKAWVPAGEGMSLYIRPFVFAADEYIGIRPSTKYKFIIFSCPVGKYYSQPLKVRVEEHYCRASKGGTGFAKTAGNYAASLNPMFAAQKDGYDQLIWTDAATHQFVEESGTMNLMFLINGKLVTPALGDTILAGVIRDSILEMAKGWGMEIEERPVAVKEIISAIDAGILQEAFGMGTAAVVAPIKTIGFQGQDYQLPEFNSDSLSSKIAKEFTDIRYGKIVDRFNWMRGI